MSAYHKNPDTTKPSWFKLEKYDKQASLDLRGWLLQFGVRRQLWWFVRTGGGNLSETATREIYTKLIEWIHDDPILQWDRLEEEFHSAIQVAFPCLAPLHSPEPRNDMAVHPTTAAELYRYQMTLAPDLRAYATRFYEQMQKGIESPENSPEYFEELDNRIKIRKLVPLLEETDVDERIPYEPALSNPLYCSSSPIFQSLLFTANVHLPDKLLEAQFMDSVRRVRAYLPKVSNISTRLPSNPAESWAQEQLLAYFDLSLEKHLPHGVNLSRSRTAELIFPPTRPGKASDSGWGLEHLVETTEPLLGEMMDGYSEPFWTLQASVAAILAKPELDVHPPDTLKAEILKTETRKSKRRKYFFFVHSRLLGAFAS
jgi:hypothetical protein